jgi:hypothetical protein
VRGVLLTRSGAYALRALEIASAGKRPNARYCIRMEKARTEMVY